MSAHAAHAAFLAAQLSSLPPLAPWTRLSPRIIRILGGNPGPFTLQGTNTYLLGTSTQRLLIDTGAGEAIWSSTLQSVLAAEGASIVKVLLTHAHADHTGGVEAVRRMAVDQAWEEPVRVYKHTPDEAAGQRAIADGDVFGVPGATVKALYTPGHSDDHVCFSLEEEDVLFSGDTVLGHGTTVFGDLAAYMRSLQRLREVGAGRLLPAHGEVVEDGVGKVVEYIRHRELREAQIVAVLKEGGAWGSREIVERIYRDVGEALLKAAESGAVQVLVKLEGEGRVVREGEGEGVKWRLVGAKL